MFNYEVLTNLRIVIFGLIIVFEAKYLQIFSKDKKFFADRQVPEKSNKN